MKHKEDNSAKVIDSLKEDATQSFLTDFETTLEKAAVVQPTMDLSKLDPSKTMVDDKLVGD